MFHLFKRRSAADLKRELLHEAEVEAVLHQASAAHHQALAGMYAARVEQLRSELDSQPRTLAEALLDTRATAKAVGTLTGNAWGSLRRFAPAGLRP